MLKNPLKSPTFVIFMAIIGGLFFGSYWQDAAKDFGIVGKILIQLVKALATPLVFLAITEAVIKYAIGKRDFINLMALSSVNAFLALLIGLSLANLTTPGEGLSVLVSGQKGDGFKSANFMELLIKQIPTSIVQPFNENNIMATVILAVLFGAALRSVQFQHTHSHGPLLEKFASLIELLREISEKMLCWVVVVMPLAVFASIAQVTATQGFGAFNGLLRYAGLCLLGMGIHVVFVYLSWIKLYVKLPLKTFFKEAMQPLVFSFGINSSLITLPLTLAALDKFKVSRRVSTLVSCIGTNFNNDGIVLYEVFTLMAIAQAYGLDIALSQQILLALFCLIASLGVSGIPEAGIVALSLVLSSLGLPTEIIALLLSVDWLLARTRSSVNTCGDLAGSLVIEKWQKRSSALT